MKKYTVIEITVNAIRENKTIGTLITQKFLWE